MSIKQNNHKLNKVDISELDAIFGMANQLTANNEKKLEKTELEQKIESKKQESKTLPIFLASSGTSIIGDKVTKNAYLSAMSLDEDLYKNVVMTEDEAKRFNKSMKKVLFGGATASAAMICSTNCKLASTCVTGDTEVMLHDGSWVQISKILSGEHVLSFNERARAVVEDVVPLNNFKRKDPRDVFLLETDFGHKIKMTACHRVYSRDVDNATDKFYYWRSMDTGLKIGDEVLFTDKYPNEKYDSGDKIPKRYGDLYVANIVNIEHIGKETVYDITVLVNNNFFGNGILVHNCELHKMGKIKTGAPCVYEQAFIAQRMSEYMDEYDVDGSKPTERDLISKLVELELYERRANIMLSTQHQDMAQEDFMGFDGSGAPIIKESTSRYIDIKERFGKQRLKILEALMGTRKERSKIAAATISSNAGLSDISSLSSKIEELRNAFSGHTKGNFVAKGVQDIIDNEKA